MRTQFPSGRRSAVGGGLSCGVIRQDAPDKPQVGALGPHAVRAEATGTRRICRTATGRGAAPCSIRRWLGRWTAW